MTAGQPIYVVGTGACTAIGASAPAVAAAVRAGISGFGEHSFLKNRFGEPAVVAAAPYLDIGMSLPERLTELAGAAATECVSALVEYNRRATGTAVIALPEKRPGKDPDRLMLETTLRGSVGEQLDLKQVEFLTTGHAGGLAALGRAMEWLCGGQADFCLVGGVDSYLDADTIDWLDRNSQLHSEETTWGFCPGEAAGFCLLASKALLDATPFPRLATILSVGLGTEQNRINTDTVCTGEGLTTAFRSALAALPPESQATHTICDMNGEPFRGDEYGFTVVRTSDMFAEGADFQAPADCWGDVGSASGPLFVLLAVEAARKRYSRGSLTMLFASSECGQRTAVLLETDVEPRQGD